jgi:two-component system chemotaxis response regulator CheB
MPEPIKVLIVDDSRLFRSAVEEALRSATDVAVVGSVFNGEKALEAIATAPPDIVTLDVEMPGMNGLEVLKQIQTFNDSRPTFAPVKVIMVSAFTRRGAQVTISALEQGAFDFVTKPSGPSADANILTLRAELLDRIRACAGSRSRVGTTPIARAPVLPIKSPIPSRRPARAIVIGASTGGPRALSTLLPALCSLVEMPILIVQHMPPDFTRSLAESLARQTGANVIEASDGLELQNRTVYIAPGGKHLLVRGPSALPRTGITDQPPENGCRPSADPLFRAAAAIFGSDVLALILTGMGRDGTIGLGAIKRAGGYVIAQDEASSVVWGMPGSAVQAGVVDEVLPLEQIAKAAAKIATGGAR